MGRAIPKTLTASQQIVAEVSAWPGVEVRPGSRGELSIQLGRKELGHLHGDRAAHFGFPKPVWFELFEQGRIDYHPVFPGQAGWGARRIADQGDVDDVIALLRLNYERAVVRRAGGESDA